MSGPAAEREDFAALVLRLRAEGVNALDLLTAVEQTPRTPFAPPYFAGSLYSSRTIPIECGAFMEGADVVVKVLDAARLKPGLRVLEIGTGSGYSAAVMSRIVERVISLERYRTLVAAAQRRLESLGIRNVIIRHADGSGGLAGEGTFDRIIATTAFTQMPRFFAEQLVSGGIMIAPMVVSDEQCRLVRLTKTGSRFEREDLFEVPYLPLVPKLSAAL